MTTRTDRLEVAMDGQEACRGCSLAKGGFHANVEKLYESNRFYVYQDLDYPVVGLAVIAAKRHFYGLDEMTDEELAEYAELLRKIRAAQRTVLNIDHVYSFYNENTPEHFHTWMIPRHEWMTRFGKSAESIVPALLHARDRRSDERNVGMVRLGIQRLRSWLH